jgi:rSAM/selenodomain-associated transferase 2
MKLSIILPALNEASGIVATLSALQPLRAAGNELIVVDGGSVDATALLASVDADQVINSACGRAKQMNAGAAAVSGDALLFLHADTRLPDGAAELIEAALQQRLWGRFDVQIEGRPALLRVVAGMMNRRSRLTGIATGDQAMFMTRAAFDAAGGFPDQPLMEDIELSKRLKRLGPPACLRQQVVTSGRRWEQHGVWRTILLMWRLRFDYWRGVPATLLARRYRPQQALREVVK